MSLVGKKLNNSIFVQDPNKSWVKIDNVAVGETFGYSTIQNNDISVLLASVITNPNIVTVVYNWSTGVAYTKSGFNLNNKSDYNSAQGYTTFIKKTSCITQPIIQPIIQPITQPILQSKFVVYNKSKSQFELNGSKFVPVGFNSYWLGLTEEYTYPTNAQITEMFKVANKMSATTIRSHTLGISSGSQNSLRPTSNTLNINAWKSIDFAFYQAKIFGIKLICPLTDAYMWYNGSINDFCKPRNVDKSSFWTDKNVISDFKSYIMNWLNHINQLTGVSIKNSPELFAIELGNELGNIRPDSDSTTIPPQSWIIDISTFIKSIDCNHIILDSSDECLGGSTSNDFYVNTIDCYQGHFYSEDYNRITYGTTNSTKINKPYIIGEYASTFDLNWFTTIEKLVNGSFFWSLYPHDNGNSSGNRIQHNDGYTIWYDNDNLNQLLILTNHMRRMQNLSEVTTLNFN